MRTFIVSGANFNEDSVKALHGLPEFRKATRNMLMAASAIKQILIPEIENRTLSLIVGSSFGELQTTNDFLTTLTSTGIARPFLFQSSLHNATTGFLTLHFGIQGPSFTVSNRYFTAENALDVAMTLLKTKKSNLALVVAAESYVEDFVEPLGELYPENVKLQDGGTALLMANDEGLQTLRIEPLAILEKIEVFTDSDNHFECVEFNDSNALELLLADIKSARPHKNLNLVKPDGTRSTLSWSKIN